MKFVPISHLMAQHAVDLRPGELCQMGIKLLLIDLDNTLSPYKKDLPSGEVIKWIASLKAEGIEPFILSNNRGDRPKVFADALGIGYIRGAKKPFTAALRSVLEKKGIRSSEAALVGDQIYTDVLCAKMAGITAILVQPISLSNPLLAVRYVLELPFRLLYKQR